MHRQRLRWWTAVAWIPSVRGLASRDDENKVGGCADMGGRAVIGWLDTTH